MPQQDTVHTVGEFDTRLLGVFGLPPSQEEQRDLKALYPFGTASRELFAKARWILDEAGAFLVAMPAIGLLKNAYLTGTVVRRGNTRELHGRCATNLGVTLTLDGVLIPDDGGFRVDALFCAVARGARQVEQVAARIEPLPEVPVSPEERSRLSRAMEPPEEATIPSGPLSIEPSEIHEGVPIPTLFDVVLTGRTDFGAFGPHPGTLLLMQAEPGAPPPLSLTLAMEGKVVNGWSLWSYPETGVRMRLPGGGQLVLDIEPTGTQRRVTWYMGRRDDPNSEPLPVLVETATVTLRVEGDTVTGNIDAAGTVQVQGQLQRTHLRTELAGTLRGAALLGTLTQTLGPLPFAGSWVDEALGRIELRQTRDVLTGTLGSAGTHLEGSAQGDVARFDWEAPPRKGWGLLRRLPPGDMLVGLRGEDGGRAEPILAVQVPAADGASMSIDERTVLSIRFLANDLLLLGKDRQAAELLQQVVTHHLQKARESVGDPLEEENQLTSAALPLTHLVHACFRMGDYARLVDRLEEALQLQRELSPDAVWRRRFRHWAGNARSALTSVAEHLQALRGKVAESLARSEFGSVGLVLAEKLVADGYPVLGAIIGMPGNLAGISATDVLTTIEGAPVAGLSFTGLIERLRGPVGSSVRVGVRSNEGTTEHELVRVPPTATPDGYGDMRAALKTLATHLQVLEERSRAALRALDERVAAVVSGSEDIRRAFARVDAAIREDAAALGASVHDVEAVGHRMFRAAPPLLALFEQSVLLNRAAMEAASRREHIPMQQALAFDAELERFLAEDSRATPFDKQQLWDLSMLLQVLYPAQFALEDVRRVLVRMGIDEAYSEMERSQQTGLANLAQVMDRWRSQLVTDAAKIQALEQGQGFYRRYVRLLVDLGLPEQALLASEAARARALLDLLVGAGARPAEPKAAPTEASNTFLSLAAAPAPTLEGLKATVRAHGCHAIEYFLAEDALFIWVIEPTGGVALRTVPVARQALLDTMERVASLLASGSLSADKELLPLMEELHARLVEPVADLLPAEGTITLVPHEALFRLPFAALRARHGVNTGRYLVEQHALTYAPSIAVLDLVHRMEEQRPPSHLPTLLALINPTFAEDVVDGNGAPFKRLDELEALLAHVLGFYAAGDSLRVLRHEAATQRAVFEAPSADVVLFATHAQVFETHPLDSYVALADGRLTVRDLSEVRLSARLVILAACETGRGRITGDGVNGVSRVLLGGGTPSLVASLWKVPELATGVQMVNFHQAWLTGGATKAQALRAAQREALRQYPYSLRAWAGFILVGGWR